VAGADVELRWDPAGHTITQAGFAAARDWVARAF
jgi:predicted esterase